MRGKDRTPLPHGWEKGTYMSRSIIERDMDESIVEKLGIKNINFRTIGDEVNLYIESASGPTVIPLPFTIPALQGSIAAGISIVDPKIFSEVFLRTITAIAGKPADQSLEDALEEHLHSEITAAMLEVRQRK